ncbi:hypothetical protein [Larsenimonas salina]|uniref:hypothetical protein n=1 Tax=Larsenimonas salina TaxID=1295565 RepID=UPI002073088A|nr:hypothetical protein [Larsenimonas salina]MCM5704991.1 hypothetical protein [Larsenimonas salina]
MKHYVCGVSQLLGATLKDSRCDRSGKVTGIDQCGDYPIIDVLWEDAERPEQVVMTHDHLAALVEASRRRADDDAYKEEQKPRRRA